MEYFKVFSVAEVLVGLALVIVRTASSQQFTSSPEHHDVMEGSNVTLQCHLTNLGGLNVFWVHDGTILTVNQLVMRNNGHYVIRGRYNLLLVNVTSDDEGEYTCQVSSSPVMEQVSTVSVTVPSEITEFPEQPEIETTLGESVRLSCSALGKPTPNITWSKEGEGQEFAREEIQTERPTDSKIRSVLLLTTNAEPNHDGIYTCSAFNGVSVPDKSSVHLKVLYPPVIHNKTAVVYTGPGQETYLPCVASAQPEPQVTWFHNGSRLGLRGLPQRKEIVVKSMEAAKDYRLRIKNVKDGDLGKYKCHVMNSKGEASTEITLTARPSKPMIMSKGKSNFADTYTLKLSVTSYVMPLVYDVMIRKDDNSTQDEWRQIDVKPAPGGQRSRVQEVSVLIPDLEHDTSYEVTVRAHNSYGWSEKSDRFVFTTNSAGVTAPPTTPIPSTQKGYNTGPTGAGSVTEAFSVTRCVLNVLLTATVVTFNLHHSLCTV